MIPRRHRRLGLAVLALAATALHGRAAAAGHRLVDVLRDLETRGMHIIFSESLVRPDMTLDFEPTGSAEQVLQQALAAHHLAARPGPQSSWLVVRSPSAGTGAASARTAPRHAVFPSHADVVDVRALVTWLGQPVRGLSARDFEVRDNGVVQEVEIVGHGDGAESPLHLVLALDLSESVKGQPLHELKRSAQDVVRALRPNDRLTLVTFSDRIQLWPTAAGDRSTVERAIEDATSGGATTLIDAVYTALEVSPAPEGPSVVVVLTDGVDVGSWLSPADVVPIAREGETAVFGIETESAMPSSFLRDLAQATGGSVWRGHGDDLTALVTRATAETRATYRLRYEPRGTDRAGPHEISVRLVDRNGRVRARRSYVRPGGSTAAPDVGAAAELVLPPDGADAATPEPPPAPRETTAPPSPAGAPALCRGAEPPLRDDYRALIELTGDGRTRAAAARLATCDPARFTRRLFDVVDTEHLPAAAALHTEAALALTDGGEAEAAARHLAVIEGRVSERLSRVVHEHRYAGQAAFWRRWLVSLGQYHQTRADPGAARRLFDLAIAAFPDDAGAWLSLGTVFEGRLSTETATGAAGAGPSRSAEKAYRTALALDSSLEEAHLRLGRLLEQRGEPADADEHLEQVTRHCQDPFVCAFAWLFRGEIAAQRGDFQAAAEDDRFALDLEPALQPARIALSHTLHRNGEPALARETLESGLRPTASVERPLWLAYHRGVGRTPERAEQALRRVLSTGSSPASARAGAQ